MQDLKPAIQLLEAAGRRLERAKTLIENSGKYNLSMNVERILFEIDEINRSLKVGAGND